MSTDSDATASDDLELAELRRHIEELDDQIVRAAGERMRMCARVAERKSETGVAMMQQGRLDRVRSLAVEAGRAEGLDAAFVHRLMDVVTTESCRLEDEVMGHEPTDTGSDPARDGSQIVAIDHVAVAVDDLEAAITELRDHYGFTLLERREVDGDHSGMTSATMRAGGATFVVCQGTSPESNVSQYVSNRGQGVQHVALSVRDHTVLLGRLQDAGADLLTGIIHAPGLDQTFSRRSSSTGLQLEFLSRTDHDGFEDDNVRELFEAMERENVW